MINSNNGFQEDLKWFHYKEQEEEYNLTIQEVLQIRNSNKYFKAKDSQKVYWLQNKKGVLKLILVKGDEEDLYEDICNLYSLGYIVNSKYKEVQYKC